jgi:hypothetical protein
MFVKLADLRWYQRRKRRPCLIGKAAGFDLLIVGRNNPVPGGPDFTVFVGRFPSTTDSKPLPLVWDPVRTRWIGPVEPDYPDGFFDDFNEAVADLKGE